MKRLYFLKYIGALLLLVSCVDLIQEPKSFLTEEEYIQIPQTIELVNKAVDGLYLDMFYNNYGFNCRLMRVNTGADDLQTAPKPNNSLFYFIELNPSPSANAKDTSELWINFWKVITSSNKIINGTPIPEDATEAKIYKQSIAEAYFMRALAYFHMVRLFGEIPIIKDGQEALNEQVRNPVEDVYEKIIIPDLEKAIEDLLAISRKNDSSTPSKWAAKACLADVYLTMAGWPLNKGQTYYQKSAVESLDIIDNSGLYLTDKYGDLWLENKKSDANEHMFALHHSATYKNPSQYGKSLYPRDYQTNGGWADYYADPDFMVKYPEGDRKSFNYMTSWPTNNGIVEWQNSQDQLPCISKYYDYDEGPGGKSAQSNGLTPIYRYADVLLMYAEASNLADGAVNARALESLQQVQNRAGSAVVTTTTDSKLFDDAVFAERGWEFLAEFKRWYDLVRREKLQNEKSEEYNKSVFKANNHYYLPLPPEELEMTNWQNNLGY